MNALESQNIMFLGGFFWSNMLPPSDSATTDEEIVTRVLRQNPHMVKSPSIQTEVQGTSQTMSFLEQTPSCMKFVKRHGSL